MTDEARQGADSFAVQTAGTVKVSGRACWAGSCARANYLTFRVLGSRVFGAKMSCKIFIAPLLVVPLHFIERITGGCS